MPLLRAILVLFPFVGGGLVGAYVIPTWGKTRLPTFVTRNVVDNTPQGWTGMTRISRRRERVLERLASSTDGGDVRMRRDANSLQEYWDQYYLDGEAGEIEEGETYDWFTDYESLATYINQHIGGSRNGRVLVLGCGNSEISLKMYEDGWKNIINIDFSEPLIEIMKHIHSDKPGLEWKVMNVRDMDELETGSFDAIVDKGLTDSLMYSDDFKYHVAQLSLGCARLLKPGGVYLLADYRDIGRLEGLFKRAEWEGGSISEIGKVTTRINLFKGTRTDDSLRILVEEQLEGLLEDVGDTDNNVEDEDGGDLSWIMDTGLQGLLGKGFMGGGSLEEGEGEGGKW